MTHVHRADKLNSINIEGRGKWILQGHVDSDDFSATAPRKQQAPYPSVVAGPALIVSIAFAPTPRAPFATRARLASRRIAPLFGAKLTF